jgi:DNA-binding transcriptional regulator YdaS (Cro superfamily)
MTTASYDSLAYEALQKAVTILRTQTAMGKLLGVSQRAVWRWLNETKKLPPEHVLTVEAATGVSRHDLRRDIYPLEDANLGADHVVRA